MVLENGCWRWTGATNARRSGGPRGLFWAGTRFQTAYRWAWEAINGLVPEGLELDHYGYPDDGCIGPLCAHPDHVRPVTHRENVLRGNGPSARNARKTACPKGHPYDRVTARGWRQCSICTAAQARTRYEATRPLHDLTVSTISASGRPAD
ncbi:hypothetical protein ABT352_04690 [Streptosporangium sp. NPDC000563]|uniref:hypothetical protein n=1 Tax=Streptosporangium sp. NPDC000563 TaxID=3154366 RepID=UPI0033246CD0